MADEGDIEQSLTDLLAQEGIDRDRLREIVEFIDPVDLAEHFQDLSVDDRVRVFDVLDPERAARVMEALPQELRRELVNRLGEERMAAVIERMSADAVADIIDSLPAHREKAILDRVDADHREDIKSLQKFEPTTAGGLMTTDFVAVPEHFTAGQTLKALQGAVDAETIEYIYVVDGTERLVGVCSIRGILRAAPEMPVKAIMHDQVQFVGATVDQEEVAKIVQKYDLKALPVVDSSLRLIGVVTQARVLEVVQKEASEDIALMAGAGTLDPVHAPVLRRVRARLPWLVAAMCIELVLSWVMKEFDLDVLALIIFIPVIMAMGGNVGLQSSTAVVRGLATGTITHGRVLRVLVAESMAGGMLGLVCGLVTGVTAVALEFRNTQVIAISGIVTVSMFASITIAAAIGTLIPFTLHRMGKDPAIASGPFITAFNDLLNVTMYLTLATLLLSKAQ